MRENLNFVNWHGLLVADFSIISQFLGHPALNDLITVRDRRILSSLNRVDVQQRDDPRSYRIELHFDESNEFFTDNMLFKDYDVDDGGQVRVETATVHWAPPPERSSGPPTTVRSRR